MPKLKHLAIAAALVFIIWLGLGVWDPPQLGKPAFQAVEALFAGLALSGVVVTLMLQNQQLQREKRESLDSAYSNRLDDVVSHFQSYFESACVEARRLAWPCIQRSYFEPEFQKIVAAFSHVPQSNREELGSFKLAEHSGDQLIGWHHATHKIDEILAYFSIFAMRIRSVEAVLKRNPDRRKEFEGLVRRMNVYWPWWGPALRYIVRLRKKHAAGEVIYGSLNFMPDFDLLDSYLLNSGASTDGQTGEQMLGALYQQEVHWTNSDGAPAEAKIARLVGPFTVERFLDVKWYEGAAEVLTPDNSSGMNLAQATIRHWG